MNFDSKQIIESAIRPGVRYTVRCLNKIQRAKRDAGTIDARARVSKLLEDARRCLDDAGNVRPECAEARTRADIECGVVMVADIMPAVIRAGLLSIEGYSIDGVPATPESLLSFGEDDLLEEIYAACVVASGLTGEQQKNWQSPGTSQPPEAGQMRPTTADAAAA